MQSFLCRTCGEKFIKLFMLREEYDTALTLTCHKCHELTHSNFSVDAEY